MNDRSRKPDDPEFKDVPMVDDSSSSVVVQSGNPAKHENHSPSAQTSQGESSTRRVIDQVITGNESSKGPQEISHIKVPKSVANSLIQGGGVSQQITDNKNEGEGQKIGCFEVYDG